MLYRILIPVFFILSFLSAQTIEECMDCHSDEELTKFIDDTIEISLFVDLEQYQKSVHGDMECVDCHSDIEDVDHGEDLADVDCAQCHDGAQEVYSESVHASGYKQGAIHAAACKDCHGTHNILYSDNEKSKTYVLNIPVVIVILNLK
jgi:Zn finger protein HypA/HybF involved in hydrogenase expression